jgi:hypothetical protein
MNAILKSLGLFADLIAGIPTIFKDFDVTPAYFDIDAATRENLRSLRNTKTWFTECASD